MLERQLDLFSGARPAPGRPPRLVLAPSPAVADLDDRALIASIPDSSLAESAALAAEAARRKLPAAVPALAALCRRFTGFGGERPVPEQVAALEALVAIGSAEAARTVAEIIERSVVHGPGLGIAVAAAARLRSQLKVHTLHRLLCHAEPGIRAGACRCARPQPELIAVLIDLLDDLDRDVVQSAACALGQMGRHEARPLLKILLREEPCEVLIDATAPVADEECMVLLGRIARSMPALARAALDALDDIDEPRAHAIAAAVRDSLQHHRARE